MMRMTRTNSGADSKGVVRLGPLTLEGESYLLVVAGAVGSVLCFLVGHALSLAPRVLVAALPLLSAVLWIRLFVAGRPPHYLGDLLEGLVLGHDFNLKPQRWRRRHHPRRGFARRGGA